MANYRSKTRTIQEWQRAFRIVVEVPLGRTPRVEFLEEHVSVEDGTTAIKMVPGCSLDLANAEALIPLRNVNTDELTGGDFTVQRLLQYLYSTYRVASEARDAA